MVYDDVRDGQMSKFIFPISIQHMGYHPPNPPNPPKKKKEKRKRKNWQL